MTSKDSLACEVIIIGSGPAGLTAGIYTARAGLRVKLIAGFKSGGQLMNTTKVENFPGFAEGIMGPDLMMAMRQQAVRFGVEIVNDEAAKVRLTERPFKVWVGEKRFRAEAVISATGARARMLGVGEEKLLGRGVAVCAVCDAPFFRGKKTAVVGGGDAAMEDALALARFAERVYVIHRRDKLKASQVMIDRVMANQKIKIKWQAVVKEVKGKQKLEGVVLASTKNGRTEELELDGLFMAIGQVPETSLFVGQLKLDERGYIKLFSQRRRDGLLRYTSATSVAGVFAAGDNHDYTYRQAITAAGYGCQAALDAERWLAKFE